MLIVRLLHLDQILTKSRMFLFFPILMVLAALPAMVADKMLGTGLLFGMVLASTMRFIVLDQHTNEVLDRLGSGAVYSVVGVIMLVVLVPLSMSLNRSISQARKEAA